MHRLLNTLFIAGLLAANASAIVTTKSNYTDPVYGTTINGIYEGVVQLQVGQPGIGTYSCSGALLSSGTQILTAAHCLSDLRGGATYGQVQLGSVVTAYFDNQGSAGIVASGFVVNPLWDISTLLGDLAIITLPSPAPLSAQRYDIYRNTDELGQVAEAGGGASLLARLGEHGEEDGGEDGDDRDDDEQFDEREPVAAQESVSKHKIRSIGR